MKNQKKPRKVELIAHRGGNAAGGDKENTIVAFKSAQKLGISYLETDVILTRDGKVLAYHGSRNRYFAYKTGLILRRKLESMNYAQIKSGVSAGGEPLPLLEELFKELPEAKFNVDAKTDAVWRPMIDVLIENRAEQRVCIATFNPVRMKKMQQYLASKKKNIQFELKIAPSVMILLKKLRLFSWYINTTKIDVVGVPFKHINKKIVKICKSNNKQIYAWTVNDEVSIRKMLDLGVDGIFSDRTDLLTKHI